MLINHISITIRRIKNRNRYQKVWDREETSCMVILLYCLNLYISSKRSRKIYIKVLKMCSPIEGEWKGMEKRIFLFFALPNLYIIACISLK